jgi:hypothetical protein
MILTFDQIRSDPQWSQIFKGGVLSRPDEWRSDLPDQILGEGGFANAVLSNPNLMLIGASSGQLQQFESQGLNIETIFNLFWGEMGRRGFSSYVTATRQLLGEMVQSIGILSSQFASLSKIYKEPADKAFKIVNIVSGIVESEAFATAIDLIGLVPVVGWIIKIIVDLAKMVTGFVKLALDAREDMARSLAASQLTLPVSGTEFSPGGDELVAQFVLRAFRYGEVATQTLVRPPYAGSHIAEGVYDDGNWSATRDETMGLGWVIHPEMALGGGYVPGTGNMTGSLFVSAGVRSAPNSELKGPGGGSVRDLGALYPTATGLLNNWWSLLLQPGPMMFTVNPQPLLVEWETYIRNILVLGPDVLQGWAEAPTGIPFSNKFWCVEGMYGAGDCKHSQRGKQLTLPSDWGLTAHASLNAHLYKLFFALQKIGDRNKNYNPDLGIGLPLLSNPKFYEAPHQGEWPEPDSIDVSESVPGQALRNLHDRQTAVLQSVDAFYVSGENPEQFPAFQNNKSLYNRWAEGITALLQSNDWRRVSFANVPDGPAKEALRQRATQAGVDPETLNPPCPPNAPMSHPCRQFPVWAGPSVLGDPPPPPPPPMNDVDVLPGVVVPPGRATRPGGKKGRKGGGAAVVLVAVAAALLASKK